MRLPVANLHCGVCMRFVDLRVGEHHNNCVDRVVCPRCGSRSTVWVTVWGPDNDSGVIYIADEEEV
jgi:hypothetical protein